MRAVSLVFLAALSAAAATCGKDSPPTPTPSPGPDGAETIRGTERIGWDQRAADPAELASFKYAIYVDGARSEIGEVSCGSSAAANGFSCSGRLPPMTPGQHTLELAAFVGEGGNLVESSRSVPLRVTVAAAVSSARAGSLRPGDAGTTSDGLPLRVDVVVERADEPADIAFAPDGRLFLAERDGMVRVIEGVGRTQAVSDLEGEILALALDPDFPRTHYVYVATVAPEPVDGAPFSDAFTIARYREANGILGERMVLLHGIPARRDRAAAALGIGPDGKLHVALDDGGDAALAGDAASLNGKVLRLERDGTTPEDQPPGTTVQLSGFRSPRAIEWNAGVMWIADGAPRAPERLSAAVVTSPRPHRSEVQRSYALAPGSDPSDAVFYRGEALTAFRGDLLVGADGGSHILRVRLDPRSPARVIATERLLDGAGPIRALAVGPDGAIYFATPTTIGRLSLAPR
jgi:glucose/arabinose dehydrogenase